LALFGAVAIIFLFILLVFTRDSKAKDNAKAQPGISIQEVEPTRRKAEQGDIAAQFKLGLFYYSRKEYEKAFPWLSKAAEKGHSNARFRLAVMYSKGYFVREDLALAFKLYTQAAEQGEGQALFNLGIWYRDNKGGVGQDDTKAFQYFLKSSKAGFLGGKHMVGLCSLEGQGTPRNENMGLKLIQEAADEGYPSAQSYIGIAYYEGKLFKQNFKKAFSWTSKAAAQGYPSAQYNLAVMLYNGEGTAVDLARAYEMAEKAAEQGHHDARLLMEKIKPSETFAEQFLREQNEQNTIQRRIDERNRYELRIENEMERRRQEKADSEAWERIREAERLQGFMDY
jgi:TPR repeat protein